MVFLACGESASTDPGSPSGASADASTARTEVDAAALEEDAGPSGPLAITTNSLLTEMSDLTRLAYGEQAPFTLRMVSSYDRASVKPGTGNANGATPFECSGWWANFDGNGFIRDETNEGRKERVLFDEEGPGAVVRMWSANPRGTLRFYFDGQSSPGFQAAMDALLVGDVEPIVGSFAYSAVTGQLEGKSYPGANLYFPIPYRSHLKITVDVPPNVAPFFGGVFYQIDYRTYDSKTADVETFDVQKVGTYGRNLVGLALGVPEVTLPKAEALKEVSATLSADNAASKITLSAEPGGSRIRKIVFENLSTDAEALRGTLLRIAFDGEQTVYVPLGDFFGGGPGATNHESLPLSSKLSGGSVTFTSRWVMPFQTSAEISLVDAAKKHLVASAHVFTEAATFDGAMLFHAVYRPQKTFAARPVQDWNIATIEGAGNYVGTVMNVVNPNGAWWGEGDEKIFVDGESFPSFFGTGTEDYFGYAWGSPQLFSRPYHAQTRYDIGKDPNNRISDARYHVVDRIPFMKSIRFDLEVQRWETANPGLILDGVALFYATKGATVNVPNPTAASLAIKSF